MGKIIRLEYDVESRNLHINKKKFSEPPFISGHRYLVKALDNVLSFYVAYQKHHSDVAQEFGFNPSMGKNDLVGGGSVYLDRQGILRVGETSGAYGVIPISVAENFGKALSEKVGKEYGKIQRVKVDVERGSKQPHNFWRHFSQFSDEFKEK